MPGTNNVSISTKYASALKAYQGLPAARAEAWQGETLLQTLAIDANGSTINTDRSAVIRRTCTVTLTDPTGTLVSSDAQNLLDSTSGNELVLYRGLTYTDGTSELIQLGVFGIEDYESDDTSGDLIITLTGNDRARAIQRAGFTDVFIIAPSTNVGTAIQVLMNSAWDGPVPLAFNFAATTAVTPTTPLVYVPGDDPMQKCLDLASGAGYALWFDRTGSPVFRPVQDPTQQSTAWSYDEGVGNIAVELIRTISRSNAPNYIIRDGQGSGIAAPVRGVAFDDNPASPTYWLGPYGQQVDYKASSLYVTQAQAQAAAQADLLLALGTLEALNILAVPKPDHDVDDVIEVTRARSGLSADRFVIDTLTLGFGAAGTLSMTGRQLT